MTKRKKEIEEAPSPEKESNETIVMTDSEEGLVPVDDVWDFLDEQSEKDYEPSFAVIEISHPTGTFAAAGFGTDDEFTGIILAAPTIRALWGFGGDEEKKEIEEWCGGLPICSSRGENARLGKGEVVKPVDAETPTSVRHLVQAIVDADYMCKEKGTDGCPWSNFGSIPGQRGQACKKCVRLLLYDPAKDIAGVLTVPPSSLKAWKNYKAGLSGQHYSRVVTKFDLNLQQQGQIKWSVLDFKPVEDATSAMIEGLRRTVRYQGTSVSQAKALVSEFLDLDLDRDTDYPDNGTKKEGDDF